MKPPADGRGNPAPPRPAIQSDITPKTKAKEQTICITNGFKSSDKVCVDIKVSECEAYLKALLPNEACERTQPTEREPTRTYNRVYVDLDGKLPNVSVVEFCQKVEAIRASFMSDLLGSHSIMESCQHGLVDGDEVVNKLSWRITYTHIHGDKETIARWVRTKFYPHAKALLLTTIPLVLTEAGQKSRPDGNLEIDMSVYNKGQRKMRMLFQSKPQQKRPNKLILGNFADTLITYIPTDSVLLRKHEVVDERVPTNTLVEADSDDEAVEGSVVTQTTSSDPYHEPTEDEEETRRLLTEVVSKLAPIRFDYYPNWLRLGFVLYNEGFTAEQFIELSKRSKHYKEKSSPKWIKEKWIHFRKSRLNQATLWKWLSEDNNEAYQTLSQRRKDFWGLMSCMSHAEVGQFFYNMKTDAYIFHEACGWYQLGANNRWDLYDKIPSMLKSDIWNTLKKVAKEHLKMLPKPEPPLDDDEGAKADYKDDMATYKKKVKAIWKFVNAIGTSGFVDGVIAFLPSMYKDDDLPQKMDEQRHLFAFSDKVIDLNTMEVRPIDPMDYICINTGYEYPETRDEDARQEVIDTLRSIFETNEEIEASPDAMGEMTTYALDHIACCLSGNPKYERFYIWTGKGGNGKGVASELVKRSFGGYYHPIPHTVITKTCDKKDAPNPPMAKAKGKRFLQFSEPEASDKLQVGCIKELTGGDEITARDLFKTTIVFKPQWYLFGQTNNIPKLNRGDGGATRRIRILQFLFSFVATPTDKWHKAINVDLKDKITKSPAWRNEFIHLLIEAYRRVVADGLHEPSAVMDASQEYNEDNNPVTAWLRNNFITGLNQADTRFWISATDMLRRFKSDMNNDTMTAEVFKSYMIVCDMEQKNVKHDKPGMIYNIGEECWEEGVVKAGRYWLGIRHKDTPEPPE